MDAGTFSAAASLAACALTARTLVAAKTRQASSSRSRAVFDWMVLYFAAIGEIAQRGSNLRACDADAGAGLQQTGNLSFGHGAASDYHAEPAGKVHEDRVEARHLAAYPPRPRDRLPASAAASSRKGSSGPSALPFSPPPSCASRVSPER